MSRRSVRIFLLLLAVSAVSFAAYRGFLNERLRQDIRAAALAADRSAVDALAQLADARGSLHASVAAGQGADFWTDRVATLLDAIRSRVLDLDQVHSGRSAELLDGLDRLAAAETRVRERLSDGQPLMAAEIIFTEARDLADVVSSRIVGIRSSIALAAGSREAAVIREQYLLASGTVGVWMFVALLFLPRVKSFTTVEVEGLHVAPQAPRPAALASKTEPESEDRDLRLDAPAVGDESAAGQRLAATPIVEPSRLDGNGSSTPGEWSELARICGELAAMTDAASLDPLLARTATWLDATGLILWSASTDGDVLRPVGSHGYDAKLLARLGSVRRDAAHLTSAVFREGVPQSSPSTAGSPAAVAVPVTGTAGTCGVLSLELKPDADLDRATTGAAIVAAQLAAAMPAPPDSAHTGRTYAAG